jgi:hypothetical protein
MARKKNEKNRTLQTEIKQVKMKSGETHQQADPTEVPLTTKSIAVD